MKQSAGILLYKTIGDHREYLLAHPGGPVWKNKDLGVWSIPKGEFNDTEHAFTAALREFEEETGVALKGDFTPLSPVKLQSGKTIHAWAIEQDFAPERLVSNTFEMEWPPKSGKLGTFPEVDRVAWFALAEALVKINAAQADFIRQIEWVKK
jgi:predicted NUDIX family NTP pyrophosphohydrolase